MFTKKITLLFIFSLAVSIQAFSAEKIPFSLPASTNVVGKLNLKSLKNEPVIQKLKKMHLPAYEHFNNQLKQGVGFDLEAVDTVWFVGDKFEEGILIFRGKFDVDDITAKVVMNTDLKMLDMKGTQLAFSMPKDDNIAAIDAKKNVIFGKSKFVKKYFQMDKHFKKGERKKLEKLLAGRNDLRLVILSWLAPPKNDEDKRFLSSFRDAVFKADLNNNLEVEIDINLSGAGRQKTWKKLLDTLLKIELNKKKHNPAENLLRQDLLSSFKIDDRNRLVRIKSNVTQKSLEKIIEMTKEKKKRKERRRK